MKLEEAKLLGRLAMKNAYYSSAVFQVDGIESISASDKRKEKNGFIK